MYIMILSSAERRSSGDAATVDASLRPLRRRGFVSENGRASNPIVCPTW